MNLVVAARAVRYLLTILASSRQRRHAYRWLRTFMFRGNYLLDARIPWITFDALDFLEQRLPPNPTVFEYGSGGSTLFWLGLEATCMSVEHDPQWFATISGHIGNREGIQYQLVPPEKAVTYRAPDSADPTQYLSSVALFEGLSFEKYVRQIDVYADLCLDVVMIDGRARPSCIMHAARKVRRGGLLILDNAERPHYTAQTQRYLEGFACFGFSGVGPCGREMWRTDIYVRKSDEY